MAAEISRADKDAEIRVEDNHMGDLVETKDEHLRDMVLGAAEAQKEGRSPWKVLLENKKVLLLILAVQVSQPSPPPTYSTTVLVQCCLSPRTL